MHKYYIKIRHDQSPAIRDAYSVCRNTHNKPENVYTSERLLLLFVGHCLDPSIMLSTDGRAVMYPHPAVIRDLHNASINNNSTTLYLKAQQIKIKQTMPIRRTSFGPQCVIAAVHRDAQTTLLSRGNQFYSRKREFSQQWFSTLFSLPPVPLLPGDKAQTIPGTNIASLQDGTICVKEIV